MWKYLLITIFFITSCSGLNIKTADRSGNINSKNKYSIDETEVITEKRPEVYNIAVVVGPGGAKTISASGILKFLHNEDLNIKYVAGLGFGALPAAIYAKNLKPLELEWQFYKLKNKSLRAKSFIGTTKNHLDSSKVSNYLKQIFNSKKIQNFKLAFACPVKKRGSADITLELSDSAVKSLMMCMDHPPLFERSTNFPAAPMGYKGLVSHFDSKDINFIIYINSLEGVSIESLSKEKLSFEDRAYWQKIIKLNQHFSEYSSFSFNINTKSLGLFDFSQASALIQKGELAVKEQFKYLEKTLKE